jgi:hypothetical protein
MPITPAEYAIGCYTQCLQNNVNFGDFVQQWLIDNNHPNLTFEEALNMHNDLELN